MADNIHTEAFAGLARLRELRIAHRDLDQAIDQVAGSPLVDQLRIRRLKKERLRIRDLISRLESALIPDLNA
jgi:hypothetical protein